MDVTEQILKHHQIYGASDNTNQSYTSSGQCLNYARGASIQKPIVYNVSVFPFKIDLKGEVGLFGAENIFIKFKINAKDTGNFCVEEEGWVCAHIDNAVQPVNPADAYTFNSANASPGQGYIDYEQLELDLIYEGAELGALTQLGGTGFKYSFYLKNNKTGNIYVDSHVDGRLYSNDRQERPYELMYITNKEDVYVGIHARNTKRLPFDMTVFIAYETIGKEPPLPAELMSPCCSATATTEY